MRILKILFALSALAFAAAPIGASAQFREQAAYGGTTGGTASALTITIPNIASYADVLNAPIRFKAAFASPGGAVTLAVSGLAPKSLYRADTANMGPGDISIGQIATVIYDGTGFQLVGVTTSLAPSSGLVNFTSSSSWTVPAGVYLVKKVKIWGGGGAGGGVTASGAGCGGGGGAYAESNGLQVTPGASVSIVVGAGGTYGTGTGGNGGSSSILGLTAPGGIGGGANSGCVPGVGGSSGSGQIALSGIVGGYGFPISGTAGGGFGGSSPFGGSVPAISLGTAGNFGIFPGGGGSGGSGTGTPANGGQGGGGFVTIEY